MEWNETLHNFYQQLDDKDKEEWLFEREACDASLFYFIVQVGGSTEKAGGDIIPEIHKPICDFWQNPTKYRKAIFMPRIWRKTTCLTKWGNIHSYLQNNELRVLIASENEKLAARFLRWMQNQLLKNERLRWLYPELQVITPAYTKANPWSRTECLLPRKGGYTEPTFTAIGITGAAQSGHYEIISCDDLIGEKGMESPSVMDDAMRWFDNVDELLDVSDLRKENPSTVRIVGTHWANGDLGHYIQNKYPIYKWIIVPALKDEELENKENIEWLHNSSVEQGESNFPQVFSTEHYNDMQTTPKGEIVFWTQHMNCPEKAEAGLNKFDIRWMRYFHWKEQNGRTYIVCENKDGSDGEVFDLASIPLRGMIDPNSFRETKSIKRGARSAILIGGQPYNSIKKFITYAWAGRPKKPSFFRDELFEAHKKQKPKIWRIDSAGVQPYIYQDILEDKRRQETHMKIAMLPIDTKKDSKDADIQGLIPSMENGEWYAHSNMQDLITEIKQYPTGLTVDLIDMMAKLDKHYLSRREREDIKVIRARESDYYQERGRSPITGY